MIPPPQAESFARTRAGTTRRAPFAALLGLAALLAAPSARATPNFPAEMQTHLSLSGQPACAVCHTDGTAGGRGTVNTPFGVSMRNAGLVAYDTTSLDTALDTLDANKTDSDGDGVPDITELKNGTDPNTPDGDGGTGTVSAPPSPPEYGCSATGAGAARGDGLLIVLALGLALRKRAPRQGRRSSEPIAKVGGTS